MPSATRDWRHPTPKSHLELTQRLLRIRSAFREGRGINGEVRKIGDTDFCFSRMVRVAIGLVLILVIVGYSAFSVITTGQVLGIDARLFLVVAPVLAAVSWAAFNIGRAAVGQLQLMLKRSRA